MNKKLVHGDLEATTKQTFMIFRLGGGDVRDRNLSRKEASDMIEMLLAAKGQQKAAEASGTPSYADIWAEATEAANKAGDDWVAKATPQFRVVQRANPLDDNSPIVKDYGTMLDVCGFSYVVIDDKRRKFAKWIISQQNSDYAVHLPHKYRMRQELGLAEACTRATLEVFRKHGVDQGFSYFSRID